MTDADAPPAASPPAAPPSLADHIRAKLAGAASPLPASKLTTGWPKHLTAGLPKGIKGKEKAVALEAMVNEALAAEVPAGRMFEHPPAKKNGPTLYATTPYRSPNDRGVVADALRSAAATPAKLADLIKAAVSATMADKAFVTDLANELARDAGLHKRSPASGKTPLYGRDPAPPPHPLEVDPGKKAFTALVIAVKKVLTAAPGVGLDHILQRLRPLVADVAPAPADRPAPAPAPRPEPQPEPPAVTPDRIRSALKAAYDQLCLFIEFQDRVVELRRLYHQAHRTLPDLTVEQFHREVEHLQQAREVELKPLNEVQRAKEPELAIQKNDRLLYYILWK